MAQGLLRVKRGFAVGAWSGIQQKRDGLRLLETTVSFAFGTRRRLVSAINSLAPLSHELSARAFLRIVYRVGVALAYIFWSAPA